MTKEYQKRLIAGLLSKDREGARLFFKEYGGYIRKSVNSIGIKDCAISNDDLFMAAVENLLQNDMKAVRAFKGGSKFSTYLFTICRRHALSLAGPPQGVKTEEFADDIPAVVSEEMEMFDDSRKNAVARAIGQCDPDTQIFIRMIFYDRKSTEEIMRFFGWNSDNTVYAKKNKVITRLKKSVRRILMKTQASITC